MAIGEAFGMKYELVKRARKAGQKDLNYGNHPSFLSYKPAHYTDDTQMSLANAKLLMAFKGDLGAITADDFIKHWLRAFQRDPRHGYSQYMYKVMRESHDTQDFKSRIDPQRGTTGGAAMRSAPFGLITDLSEVKRLTTLQAKITHDTPSGINSALAIALSVWYLHHGGPRQGLTDFLNKELGPDWAGPQNGFEDKPNNGLKIAKQAVQTLLSANTLSGLLLKAVNDNNKGDTDTICALAMVMATRCRDITNDLPVELTDKLENKLYGREYLQNFDAKLLNSFPLNRPGNNKKPLNRFK